MQFRAVLRNAFSRPNWTLSPQQTGQPVQGKPDTRELAIERDNRYGILGFSPEDFMANKRLSMRRIKEVLRMYFEQKRSLRLIAQAMSISPSTVSDYVSRAQAAGLSYPFSRPMGDDELERLPFPRPPSSVKRPDPDWPSVYAAMRTKGMTLTLAWQ